MNKIRLVRSGPPAALFGRETKVVLSDKKCQSQPENISYPWCTVSDALRKKA